MSKNRKKKSFTLILRNYFITGVVVLIPIGFTLYLTKFIISVSSKVIPQNLNPNSYLPYAIPGIEILISIIFITIVGGLSLSFLGKRILKLIDDLFKRIPFLRTVYSAIVQMTETFSKKDNNQKSVVLVEYPRKGTWAVGFGVVGTNTLINCLFVFFAISPLFSLVAKPTAQTFCLGYSTKTTLFLLSLSLFENVSVI